MSLSRILLLPLAFSAAFAAGQTASQPRFVRASGEATLTVKPDRASLDVAVVTRSASSENGAQIAASQNARKTTEVLDAIRKALGNAGEVKTANYSIAPQYQYGNNQPPRITGYEATNRVIVTVDDLSILGKIIDASTNSGANNVSGISFSLKDDTAVRQKVLAAAAAKARANAEAIAKALNVQVVGVLEAEPGETRFRPVEEYSTLEAAPRALAAAAPTPINAGNLDVHATVTVTLEIR